MLKEAAILVGVIGVFAGTIGSGVIAGDCIGKYIVKNAFKKGQKEVKEHIDGKEYRIVCYQ